MVCTDRPAFEVSSCVRSGAPERPISHLRSGTGVSRLADGRRVPSVQDLEGKHVVARGGEESSARHGVVPWSPLLRWIWSPPTPVAWIGKEVAFTTIVPVGSATQ